MKCGLLKESPKWMVYFKTMGESERNFVRKWFVTCKGKKARQSSFLEIVAYALDTIKYDYKIASLEPSLDEEGNLYYQEGCSVCISLKCREWEEKIKAFAPEYNSDIATLSELYLWYAYRIARGDWELECVCEDSSTEGNYANSSKSSHMLEVSGARVVGGERDGQGNTFKIVRDGGFIWSGGTYNSFGHHITIATHGAYNIECVDCPGTAVAVLR